MVWPIFIHLVVCLTTGPKPLRKRAVHIVRSRASSFKWEYPLLSLMSSNSFVRLLNCLPVTSVPPLPLCIFPSITSCRRQFLRKMWPIQFAFHLRVSCRIFLCSLTLSNTSTQAKKNKSVSTAFRQGTRSLLCSSSVMLISVWLGSRRWTLRGHSYTVLLFDIIATALQSNMRDCRSVSEIGKVKHLKHSNSWLLLLKSFNVTNHGLKI